MTGFPPGVWVKLGVAEKVGVDEDVEVELQVKVGVAVPDEIVGDFVIVEVRV